MPDELNNIPLFTPTPEQAEAVETIIGWFRDPDNRPKFYVLKGYAGTGKTYLMTFLARTGLMPHCDSTKSIDGGSCSKRIPCDGQLLAGGKFSGGCGEPCDFIMDTKPARFIKPERICFTAPTNKAVKVLRNYLNKAKLSECATATIYSLLGLSLQPNGEVRELVSPEEPVDLSHYDLIVVDETSMVNRFLMDAVEDAFEEWGVPFLFMGDPAQLPPVGETATPVWKIENQSLLTQVMRYGDSMLDLATSIRNVVDNPFPAVKIETAPPVFKLGKGDWASAMLENLDLFKSGDAKCIAWRNVVVDQHNAFLRRHIFGAAEARENRWLPDDKIVATAHLKNLDDETFMRTDEEATILQIARGFHPRFSDYEIWNLLVLDENDRKVTIRTLTPEGQFALNNKLNELSMEAKSGKKWLWRQFWQLKEAFNEVRHSYAITSHRSQGSSYRKTFVDLQDIMLNRNRQEAFRSLYVSCTRQREEIYIA